MILENGTDCHELVCGLFGGARRKWNKCSLLGSGYPSLCLRTSKSSSVGELITLFLNVILPHSPLIFIVKYCNLSGICYLIV